ncbi:MAG: hypothetical protein EPO65_03810 [Dehalococcoidia bacterium]|nr:MAG: hypothetical protein EPO65_03810 [Dehalococcoidia bacterium]
MLHILATRRLVIGLVLILLLAVGALAAMSASQDRRRPGVPPNDANVPPAPAAEVACPALDPGRIARLQLTPAEQEVLRSACDRIALQRRGEITLRIVDAQGTAVRGLPVDVVQVRHGFPFGGHPNEVAAGTLAPDERAAYEDAFFGLFNHVVWGFPWRTMEPERGVVRLDLIDRAIEWSGRGHATLRGHALIYPQSQPRWLIELPNAVEQQRLADAHVRAVVGRARGRVQAWDVVNEAKNSASLTVMQRGQQIVSPQIDEATVRTIAGYAAPAFQSAHEADPRAVLMINDNRMLSGRQVGKVEAILQELQRRQAPFNGVGIQAHAREEGRVSLDQAHQNLDRIARYGRIYLTEISVPSRPQRPGESVFDAIDWPGWSEETQADYAVALFTLAFGHPAVDEVTYWSVTDRREDPPTTATGLMRSDLSRRPVYSALQDLVRGTWWTRASLRPDPEGTARLRAFLGDYAVTATLPDGRRLTGTFTASKPAEEITVTLR